MKKRQWNVRRTYMEQPDARSRWDRSYQSLTQWSEKGLRGQPSSPYSQENSDENGDVRSGFNESDKHKRKRSSNSCNGSHEYSQKQGWEWEEQSMFRDDGYSGASLRRPGLDRLRDQVRNAAFDRVLVTAPDRLARNYVHQMLLIEEFEQGGCQIEFIDQPMSHNPHDQLLVPHPWSSG
jgi:DNA invertase Pin-like site-specific DNA recombinase